jgi:protocatechuate 3,4-dioxygenase beta subunit
MSSEKLELRLGRSDAKVSGVVTDEQGNPVPVIEVVLIPENRASPVQVERTTDTNSQGRFTIANIVPGDYRVSARVALKPYAYSDAELVEKNDRGGTLIRISERTNLVVQVKALMPSSR